MGYDLGEDTFYGQQLSNFAPKPTASHLMSQFQIGTEVELHFDDERGRNYVLRATVFAVRYTDSAVFYDVCVPLAHTGLFSIIKNVRDGLSAVGEEPTRLVSVSEMKEAVVQEIRSQFHVVGAEGDTNDPQDTSGD